MFEADAQTLKDLQIFPPAKGDNSVMALFDAVDSYGGKQRLEQMFRTPLSDIVEIRARIDYINYIESEGIALSANAEILDFIEYYYSLTQIPSRYSFVDGLRKKWGARLKDNNEYYIITRAVKLLVGIIRELYAFANSGSEGRHPALFHEISAQIKEAVESEDLAPVLHHKGKAFSAYEIEKFDHIFRYKRRDEVRELLKTIYTIDVFQAVVKTKNKLGFVFPTLSDTPGISIKGLYHPFINDPVPNDISMNNSSVLFITGANMAGKSTFMKAFGLSVYLAHMGFPVPAAEMTLSVLDGMFTTINVPDDLSLGYSHFYSEVKRIKTVAENMGDGKRYVVIFDELFRGTNVKDAYEATLTIIESFAGISNSFFLFSSHLIETAQELAKRTPGIQFRSFRTGISGGLLSYSYKMQEGVSDDRFGMYIIEREGITGLLKKKKGAE